MCRECGDRPHCFHAERFCDAQFFGMFSDERDAGRARSQRLRREKADDVIVRVAGAEQGPVTIVSDDRDVADRVRAHRAQATYC